MDSLQVAEINVAFMTFFPLWIKPLGAITIVGIIVVIAKKFIRIN